MRNESIDELHRLCGIYTMPEVAGEILDAVGWREDADLSDVRLLEPAAGNGEFVVQAGRRLVASYRARGIEPKVGMLREQIVAFELQPRAAAEAQCRIAAALGKMGVHHRTAAACSAAWIRNADFLLADMPEAAFTHVVGNPPVHPMVEDPRYPEIDLRRSSSARGGRWRPVSPLSWIARSLSFEQVGNADFSVRTDGCTWRSRSVFERGGCECWIFAPTIP